MLLPVVVGIAALAGGFLVVFCLGLALFHGGLVEIGKLLFLPFVNEQRRKSDLRNADALEQAMDAQKVLQKELAAYDAPKGKKSGNRPPHFWKLRCRRTE